MNKTNKKALIAVIALIATIAVLIGGYFLLAPKGSAGEKAITVTVVDGAKAQTDFPISTSAEMLGDALLEAKLAEGEKGEYGLFITSVNGIAADSSKSEWWCITKGGAEVLTGADTTPIANGDKFELTLSTF